MYKDWGSLVVHVEVYSGYIDLEVAYAHEEVQEEELDGRMEGESARHVHGKATARTGLE